MKIIKESINDDMVRLDRFMHSYYYGLPKVKIQDRPIEEIKEMRNISTRLANRALKMKNQEDFNLYSVYRNILDIEIEKSKDNYELKKQIEHDIWSTIHNQEIDHDALRKLNSKYKDNQSLYRSIRKRILDKEMWYD